MHLLIQSPIDAVPAYTVFPSLGHAAQYVLLTQYVFFGHWLQGGMPSVENVPATHMAWHCDCDVLPVFLVPLPEPHGVHCEFPLRAL